MDFVPEAEFAVVGGGGMFFRDPSAERRAKSMDGERPLTVAGINPFRVAPTKPAKETVENEIPRVNRIQNATCTGD